jgi:hypothetical protein
LRVSPVAAAMPGGFSRRVLCAGRLRRQGRDAIGAVGPLVGDGARRDQPVLHGDQGGCGAAGLVQLCSTWLPTVFGLIAARDRLVGLAAGEESEDLNFPFDEGLT